MWHFLFGRNILFDNNQYMAVQLTPRALPSPRLNWLWNCGTPRPAFVQLLVKTQRQLCVEEWRPTTAQNLGNGHVVRRRWNRTTAQQLGEIEKDTKRVKRVMFEGRVTEGDGHSDTHWSRNALNAPLPSSLLHFTFLFYTLLFFFLLLPTILVYRQGTLVPKEKQWTSEVLECFLLTQAVTFGLWRTSNWLGDRTDTCFMKSS